ncbi:hypothetical protein HDU93_008933 [Gonapodya sp. JEL0774]|nr:hypothetical protein HDU93_008933 [Gonapodya sp. JEL0774]
MGLGKTVQSIALILTNRPPLSGPRATLVVAPVSLISQWKDEIKSKTLLGALRVMIHHGPGRTKDVRKFSGMDVILTQECPSARKSKKSADVKKPEKPPGPLLLMRYYRVILDEAHNIKNKDTATAKACFELEAEHRWCLTGTPIQNSVDDFYSLLKFLQFKPYDEHAYFKHYITYWLTKGKGVTAIKRLQVIIKAIVMRRTKAVIDLKLPKKTIHHVLCDFTPVERALYNEHEATAKAKVTEMVEEAGLDKNVNTISALNILLKLRQICNHMKLIGATDLDTIERENEDDTDEMDDLAAALNNMSVGTKCKFCFDPSVLVKSNGSNNKEDARETTPRSSAKVNKVIEIINDIRRANPRAKTIVFSQFVKMIDLLEDPLRANGTNFLRYQGSMNEKNRSEVLNKFKTDSRCTVLLASLKCASLGLNLTVASNVILFDPWWNPAVENQAMDRSHRLGQTKPVNVYKITIRDTVEDRILEMQARKAALADGALGEGEYNNKSKAKLTLEEIAYIFSVDGVMDDDPSRGKGKRKI